MGIIRGLTFAIFAIAGLHGRERYSLKNMTILLITWAASLSLKR
jgi:hypothetical protein